MSTVTARKLTCEDLWVIPDDGKRYELIDGEVHVSPSPTTKHQQVLANIFAGLHAHITSHNLGKIYFAPLDVVFDEHNVVQPDLLYISKERRSVITPRFIHGAPDLVVEAISESRAAYDRDIKSRLYARNGVKEVWYPDPRNDTMEVLNLTAEGQYAVTQRLSGDEAVRSSVLPDLELNLREIFS